MQLFLLMMGTWLPETCRENKSIYQEKLCTKLALFTRLYRAARSTNIKTRNISTDTNRRVAISRNIPRKYMED
jgi:hypothetical protein